MSERLAALRLAELSAAQRDLYDEILGGPRAGGPQLFAMTDAEGGLTGPFNAMLLAPRLGAALQGLGSAVRYHTDLSARVREMAILAVAAAWHSDFERYAHEAVGRAAGVSEAEMAALRRGELPELTDPIERAALRVVDALLARADLDDAEFETARSELGAAALVELSTLVGYYATLALQLRVFRVSSPQG